MDIGHSKRVIAGNTTAALAIANVIAAFGYGAHGGPATRKVRKPAPSMVCSPPEEIAAWAANVAPRNKLRKLKNPPRYNGTGQHPKFAKERVHKQHKHPLRDEHGAYTVVGPMFHAPHLSGSPRYHDANNGFVRRKWLAGISAQRGY